YHLRSETARLEGRWSLLCAESEGVALPAELLPTGKQVIRGNENVVWLAGEVVAKAAFRLDPSHQPKTIDHILTTGPNQGQMESGIYKREEATVTFCFASPGRPLPTEFTTRTGDGKTRSVWKRDR